METEGRNPKPKQASNNTPAIVLVILFGVVVLLLYAGWNLMSDDASNIADMKSVEKANTTTTTESSTLDTDVVAETSVPIVEEREEIVEEVKIETPAPTTTEKKTETPAKTTTTYSGQTASHTVKDNETFFAIATKFNTSVDNLKSMNPDVNSDALKVGVTKVKVPVQAVHTVGPGDILRVVATKYGISVDALMSANGKKKNNSQRGEKLLIPHKKKV
jgi:LysM repeat protein